MVMLRTVGNAFFLNYHCFQLHTSQFLKQGDKLLKLKPRISSFDVEYKIKNKLPDIVKGKVIAVKLQQYRGVTEQEFKEKMKMIAGVVNATAKKNDVIVQLKEKQGVLYITGQAKPEET